MRTMASHAPFTYDSVTARRGRSLARRPEHEDRSLAGLRHSDVARVLRDPKRDTLNVVPGRLESSYAGER